MTIDPAIADALYIVGIVGALGAVAIVARRYVESHRPTTAGDWAESDFGDHPSVTEILSHNGTHTETGA